MLQLKEFFQWLLDAVKILIIIQPWQTGIIVRCGKKIRKVSGGIFFKLPYFDNVFIQESRLRVCTLPMQTLTTKDLKTITLNSCIGYSISDIEKLYNTLYHPETTIANITMSIIVEYISARNLEEINTTEIEAYVLDRLKEYDYGLSFESYRIENYAIVRTYRLIQDQSWFNEGLSMDTKRND